MSRSIQTNNSVWVLLISLVLFTVNLQAEPLLVIGIEDGDTLLVELNGKSERLQLAGIDAPETVENAKLKHDINRSGLPQAKLLILGQLATDHLGTLIKIGDQLQLIGQLGEQDRYGRITAQVRNSNALSLSELMVADGYAMALRRHAKSRTLKDQLIKLEQQAINQNFGLWGKQRPEAIAWHGQTK
jgi:endonuclease YncB( thermonuclease family)